jgi:hypothetical protein
MRCEDAGAKVLDAHTLQAKRCFEWLLNMAAMSMVKLDEVLA